MSQIKLTPEDLRTSAQKYTRGSEDVSQVLSSLKHEQEVIRGNWDGSAFRSFDAQFEALSPKIAHLLQDINAQLLKVADIVEETDESIASQIH